MVDKTPEKERTVRRALTVASRARWRERSSPWACSSSSSVSPRRRSPPREFHTSVRVLERKQTVGFPGMAGKKEPPTAPAQADGSSGKDAPLEFAMATDELLLHALILLSCLPRDRMRSWNRNVQVYPGKAAHWASSQSSFQVAILK